MSELRRTHEAVTGKSTIGDGILRGIQEEGDGDRYRKAASGEFALAR